MYGKNKKNVWHVYGKNAKSAITKNQLALPVLSHSDSRFLLSSFLLFTETEVNTLADIIIRNLDDDVVLRIDKLAKRKKMSREAYLRHQLNLLSYSPALKEFESNYTRLVKQVCDFIEHQNLEFEKTIKKTTPNH